MYSGHFCLDTTFLGYIVKLWYIQNHTIMNCVKMVFLFLQDLYNIGWERKEKLDFSISIYFPHKIIFFFFYIITIHT